MTISITIEANTGEELRAKVCATLGIEIVGPTTSADFVATEPTPAAPEATAPATPAKVNAAQSNAAAGVAPKGKRGRPAKTTAPSSEARDGATPSVSEPQAQVGNSASEGGGSPSAATSPSAAPAAPTTVTAAVPGAAGVTFDDMKAKLQAVAAKREGDKDDNAGLARASAIIGKFGYRKIKEVKPEHYGAVVAECAKAA